MNVFVQDTAFHKLQTYKRNTVKNISVWCGLIHPLSGTKGQRRGPQKEPQTKGT